MTRNITLALLLFLALSAGVYLYRKYRVPATVDFSKLRLTDLDANPVTPERLSAPLTFISFFATWCPPCMAELPALQEAEKALAPEGVRFILISDEPVGTLKKLYQRTDKTFTIYHSEVSLKDLDIHTIPASYVINSRKEIVYSRIGIENWSDSAVLDELRHLPR